MAVMLSESRKSVTIRINVGKTLNASAFSVYSEVSMMTSAIAMFSESSNIEHPRRHGHDHQDDQNDRSAGDPNLGRGGDAIHYGRRGGLGGRGRYSGHTVTVTSLKVSARPPGSCSVWRQAMVRFLSL